MKNMKKLLTLATGTALLAGCSAPKMAEYAAKTDLTSKAKFDYNKDKIRDNGKGFAVDMAKLGHMPKRVALVTFFVDDPGLSEAHSTGNGRSFSTTNTGSNNAKIFANEFYAAGIDNMKASFKKYDMDLVTPSEFLNDDDKKQAYNDFVVRHSTMNKIGQKLMGALKSMGAAAGKIETDEPADGFRLVKVNNVETGDYKHKTVGGYNLAGCIDGQMVESVGYDLCKSLDVDAVLIVYNSQVADEKWGKTRFWFGALSMYMFGPNPTPLKEGKKDNNFYSKGIFYSGVRMPFSHGLLINPKIKKDMTKEKVDADNHTAYNNMITGCVTKMGDAMQKDLGKAKK